MSTVGVEVRVRYESPCGMYVSDKPQHVIDHAARCVRCSAAARAADVAREGPDPSTTLTRAQAVDQCEQILEVYGRLLSQPYQPESGQRQVTRLLTAISCLERALHHETSGRLGREHANTQSVQDRLEQGTGQARP